jgi:hypothetical protein
MSHGVRSGNKLVKTVPVTEKALARIKTPEATKFWKPVPHAMVPKLITEAVINRGWDLIGSNGQRFQMVATQDGSKLFGVCKIQIPNVETGDDFQLALGFRNSSDKTLGLRMALGTHVTVCSNLMISADIQISRMHLSGIDPVSMLEELFSRIPEGAKTLSRWMFGLKEIQVTKDEGVGFLADCVERKALSSFDFMDARASFLSAYRNENPAIQYGNTVWSCVQACTETWKGHLLSSVQPSTEKLKTLVADRYSIN